MRNPLSLLTLLLVAPYALLAQIDPGFSWVNPCPMADEFYDVEWIAPATFVAVSHNGVIYRTDDAGTSWSPVHSELYGALYSVRRGPGFVVAGGQAGRMHVSTDDGRTWTYGKIPDYPYSVRDIHIFDRDRIIAVGSNLSYSAKIAYTRDGMKTWTIVNPDSGYIYIGVDFIDDLNGRVCGSPGVLLQTDDGGETWTKDTSSLIPGKALSALAFRNRDTGVVAGDVGRILATHDGGATWMTRPQSTATIFREATWLDDSTIILLGDGQQVRSTDAGLTWSEMIAGRAISGLGFGEDGREGMVVGSRGEMLYTDDGALSWKNLIRGVLSYRILDLAFHDEGHGVAVGQTSGVIYTRDSAKTWQRGEFDVRESVGDLIRVSHVSPDTVVAMSATGLFLSTDGGENWTRSDYPGSGTLRDMYFLPSGTGWAVGDATLLRTTNGGADWTEEPVPAPSVFWSVYALDERSVYVTAAGGRLFFTRNGGASWTERQTNSAATFTMVRVDESGRNITLGWERGLFVSTGAGIFWEERRAPEGAILSNFSFLSPAEGWVGQHEGPMLSTTDAGRTWQEHEYGLRTTLMSVVEMLRPGFGYLAGNRGYILEYRDPDISSVPNPPTVDPNNRPESGSQLLIHLENEQLTVSGFPTSATTLHMYDAQGRLVGTIDLSSSPTDRASFNVDRLPGGVYIVVEQGSGSYGSFVKN